MLRTLMLQPTTQDAELLRLCQCRQWMEAARRSQSHPFEAKPNEVCLRGEGSTVLSMAVRSGASLGVVEPLLAAHVHQIGITHRLRGSILHDAIKHEVSSDVFCYLLERVIQYQTTVLDRDSSRQYVCSSNEVGQIQEFRSVSVQDNRAVGGDGPDLLGCQDDLGRTVLHHLVGQLNRSDSNIRNWSFNSTFECIRTILQAYPPIVHIMDADGNTPLLLLLLLAPYHVHATTSMESSSSSPAELEIDQVVELILSSCPNCVSVPRKMPRPWRFHASLSSPMRPFLWDNNHHHHKSNAQLVVEWSLTPLYYALLNGRSLNTVKLLIQANRKQGICGSLPIVTPHQEVCLHIAVTTRAPLDIIEAVYNDAPVAVTVPDVSGLTCLDWLWIRHVLDLNVDPRDLVSNRVISRRRLISTPFPEWFESASSIQANMDDTLPQSDKLMVALHRLLCRMKMLLPGAAAAMEKTNHFSVGNSTCVDDDDGDTMRRMTCWNLLHAACFVPGPVAFVRVALAMDPDAQRSLCRQDEKGRYPLHYAAERCTPYAVCVPLGIVSPKIETVCDTQLALEEILPRFPHACQAVDRYGQLPLHIAIDSSKRYRAAEVVISSKRDHDMVMGPAFEMPALQLLLSHYPCALTRRDGKTALFPWQQAAVGKGADLTVIYNLLRWEPSLVGGMSTD